MDFMGSPHTTRIPIVGFAKHFEALVDKNIMNHKIGDTVRQNTETDGPSLPKSSVVTNHDTSHAYHGVEYEKGIVAFKPRIVVFAMVVFMQAP